MLVQIEQIKTTGQWGRWEIWIMAIQREGTKHRISHYLADKNRYVEVGIRYFLVR